MLQYIGGGALERITEFPAKKLWLDGLILERLYLNAAAKAGLAKDPRVQRSLLWAEDQFLASRYSQRVNAKVTLADARRYYDEHKEEFQSPDQLRLRQILVAEAADAASVQAKLKQGERFEDMAKTFSTDRASAGKGGEIGWVRKGMLHPEVEQVVFQLKPHQISDPIRAPAGHYIVKLEERVVGAERTFDKVASYILMQLKAKAVEAERDRLARLYKVVIPRGPVDSP